MENQIEKIEETISKLKQSSDNSNEKVIKELSDLRKEILHENKILESENFRYIINPIIEEYQLNVELYEY